MYKSCVAILSVTPVTKKTENPVLIIARVCNTKLKVKRRGISMEVVPEKINNFFEHKILFCAASSCFCRHEILFLCNINIFCWHETLFRATATWFCLHQITFGATSSFWFRHKIVFHATPDFCFGHRLECYVMVIYFYCHVATKIQSRVEKKTFLSDTKKIISFFVYHKFFIFSFLAACYSSS